MATTPQWVVFQNSMRIEFVHTHLHTSAYPWRNKVYILAEGTQRNCLKKGPD